MVSMHSNIAETMASGSKDQRLDSAIEQLLFNEFAAQPHRFFIAPSKRGVSLDYAVAQWAGTPGLFVIVPQVRAGKYRLDFLMMDSASDRLLGIECDGRQFHSSDAHVFFDTMRDDRSMHWHGIMVLRIAGSDIWSDPTACVKRCVQAMTWGDAI